MTGSSYSGADSYTAIPQGTARSARTELLTDRSHRDRLAAVSERFHAHQLGLEQDRQDTRDVSNSRMFGYFFDGQHRMEAGNYGALTTEMDFTGQQVMVRIVGKKK